MKLFSLITAILFSLSAFSQNVAVNNTGAIPHSTAMLDVSSDTKGMLIPRMNSIRRMGIISPATGLMVYDTDTNSFWFYNSGWQQIKTLSSSDSTWAKTGDSIYTTSLSYKTGIGTSAPSEKLDVNGNINLQGNLKVNGIAGQEGQVLMTNAAGATQWTDLCDYKNLVTFTQSGSWIVPAGITKIMIEGWAGGGGGANGGGGASSSYMRVHNIPVIAAQQVNITVGTGGVGSSSVSSPGGNGGNTIVQIPAASLSFQVNGAAGASSSHGGSPSIFVQTGTQSNIIYIHGNNGSNTIENFEQYSATAFAIRKAFGNGGDAVMINGAKGGKGGSEAKDSITGSSLGFFDSTGGRGFGAGGGGGFSSTAPFGSPGAPGAVIIHY